MKRFLFLVLIFCIVGCGLITMMPAACVTSNPNVIPGQTLYFTAPYTTWDGRLSFDYDTDGEETKQYTKKECCSTAGIGECTFVSGGWVADHVPACGDQWGYYSCGYLPKVGCCIRQNHRSMVQACR